MNPARHDTNLIALNKHPPCFIANLSRHGDFVTFSY
jgi:hypothetical protein